MILLTLACTGQHPGSDDYEYLHSFEDSSPPPDINALEDILMESIEAIKQINVLPVMDLYETFFSQASDHCPRWFTNNDGTFWSDSCTANSGVTFQGVGFIDNFTDRIDPDGNTLSGSSIYCEGTITGADGRQLNCSGTVQYVNGVNPDGAPFITTYIDPYSTLINGVLTSYPKHNEFSINTEQFSYTYYNSVLYLEDGIVTFDGNGLSSVGECTIEPNGIQSIQLNTADNEEWVFLQWHGPQDDQIFNVEDCDGCADVYYKGSYLGQVCADFTSWND